MIRVLFKKTAIFLLIILPVLSWTFVPDNAFSAEEEETRIFIKDFNVIGNEAITDEIILEAISSYRDNDYTLEELKFIADIVTMLYQEDGYMLAKAYIPPQYIKDGIVKVVVVEGELGSLEISYSNYYSMGHVCNFFSSLLGDAVNESKIERAILLANETPSMNVQTAFKKGETAGTTDLKIDIEDTYPMFFDFEFNNYGNERVSKNRYIANFSMTDPTIGSTLSLKAMVGEQLKDSFNGGIDLRIPLNYEGTKLGMRYVNADYVVGDDLQAIGIEGKAEIMGAYVSHPFIHSRKQKLKGTVGFDMKQIFSYAVGGQQSNDDLSIVYARLDYDSLDRFLGKNYVSATYSQGFEGFLGSNQLETQDRVADRARLGNSGSGPSREDADGRFYKFNADYVRIQRLWEKLLLLFKTSGQYANQRLLASEQYNIGGAYSVRGQELAVYQGDHGYQMSAELSAPIPFFDKIINTITSTVSSSDGCETCNYRYVAFLDHGGVFISHLRGGEVESEYATGVGVGARFYLFDRVNIKLDVAWPFRNNSIDRKMEIFYAQVSAKVIKF